MSDVLYKADVRDATDEDCSDAEADDDDQVQRTTRYGCGGTVQTSCGQRPSGWLKKKPQKDKNSQVVNSISALQSL